MAPKKRTTPKNGSDDGSDQPPPGSAETPTLGNPGADPQRIHREYVEQHFGGGEEPTPEAYERALDEWHRLPGAAHRPPGEIRGPEEAQALEERRAPDSADEAAPPAPEDDAPEGAAGTAAEDGPDGPEGGAS